MTSSTSPTGSTPSTSAIVYLCTDLLFTSKIRETAQALGHSATAARDARSFGEAARHAAAVIIDLRRPDALEALDALPSEPAERPARIIGFIDHERTDRMEEARRRGCLALAKGKFSSDLRNLLAP